MKKPEPITLPPDQQFDFHGKKVVGLRFSGYKSNDAVAALVVFEGEKPQAVSVNVERHTPILREGEFFLANYGESQELATALLDRKILKVASNIRARVVPGSQTKVPIVKVSDDSLR